MTILAAVSLVAWVGLLLGRRGFWRADQVLPAAQGPQTWPKVSIVIPARDEAGTIAAVVGAHKEAGYSGPMSITVADDGSSDATPALAREAGAQTVSVPP
ncbi:MAG: glycosyltransferase, partial [Parvularcula sp.]|nr:glycosyltransferase [Parvularcula sp.]